MALPLPATNASRSIFSQQVPGDGPAFSEENPAQRTFELAPKMNRVRRVKEIMKGQAALPELALVALAGGASIAPLGMRHGVGAKLRVR